MAKGKDEQFVPEVDPTERLSPLAAVGKVKGTVIFGINFILYLSVMKNLIIKMFLLLHYHHRE